MYCGKCRAENLPDAAFCGTCGAPLAKEAPTGSAAGQAALSQKPGAARNPARDRKLGIAAAAVVAAAAHKEGDADAGAIGNIIFLDHCVVHRLTS